MSAKQLNLLAMPAEDAATRIARTAYASLIDARKRDSAFLMTATTLADALRAPLAAELPAVKRVGTRNVLFDALAAACGFQEPFTPSARGQVGKALAEIVKTFPATDAADMTRIATAVRKKYENAGPMAVSAHFHEFVRRPRKPQEPTAPAGWLAKLNELFPDSVLAKGQAFEITKETEYNWRGLDQSVRDAILSSPNTTMSNAGANTET